MSISISLRKRKWRKVKTGNCWGKKGLGIANSFQVVCGGALTNDKAERGPIR